MPDDPSIQVPEDRFRVNLRKDCEVRYWTKRLGCTAKELRTAVKLVGPMASDVERALQRADALVGARDPGSSRP